MFVCYATPPKRFASRAPNVQGVIHDPPVGSSQFIFFEIHRTISLSIELLFVVITYNCQ